MSEWSEILESRRNKLGISKREIFKETCLNESSVTRTLNGGDVHLDTFKKVANYLGFALRLCDEDGKFIDSMRWQLKRKKITYKSLIELSGFTLKTLTRCIQEEDTSIGTYRKVLEYMGLKMYLLPKMKYIDYGTKEEMASEYTKDRSSRKCFADGWDSSKIRIVEQIKMFSRDYFGKTMDIASFAEMLCDDLMSKP